MLLPLPRGWHGDPVKDSSCSNAMVSRYQKRISGPLLDRIDIHVEVPRVEYDKLTDDRLGEKSENIRGRVEKAREVQRQRFAGTSLACNADMGPAEVREYCQVDEAGRSLLKAAMQQLAMSARAFHRVLKLARTIAEPEGSEQIDTALRGAFFLAPVCGIVEDARGMIPTRASKGKSDAAIARARSMLAAGVSNSRRTTPGSISETRKVLSRAASRAIWYAL